MKIAAFAIAATVAATTSASAFELGNTGVSINAELDTYYDFEVEGVQSILTPTLAYNAWGIDLFAETDLAIVTDNTFTVQDVFDEPVLTLGAGYTVNYGLGIRAYGEVEMDKDFDFANAKAGVALSF